MISSRSLEEIQAEVRKVRLLIQNLSGEVGSNQDQMKEISAYEKFEAEVTKAKEERARLESFIEALDEFVETRVIVYKKYCHYVAFKVDYFFSLILKQKGMDGHLAIDFGDIERDGFAKTADRPNTLEIQVQPRGKSGDETLDTDLEILSSTKSLSGGERSYSTVAFLIALWDFCDSPFRLMDEVDVFMDMVTRKISIETLVNHASLNSSKQYIFLSPLKLQNVEHPEFVKIHRMPDIVRD